MIHFDKEMLLRRALKLKYFETKRMTERMMDNGEIYLSLQITAY